MFHINDFAEGKSTTLKQSNPRLHEKILRMSVAIAAERLSRLRRAKHTPHVLAHARHLSALARYRKLHAYEELSESIPY